jgi:hypothetical protein
VREGKSLCLNNGWRRGRLRSEMCFKNCGLSQSAKIHWVYTICPALGSGCSSMNRSSPCPLRAYKIMTISKIISNKLEIFSLLFPHPFELLLWTLISRGVTHQFTFILLSVPYPQSGK